MYVDVYIYKEEWYWENCSCVNQIDGIESETCERKNQLQIRMRNGVLQRLVNMWEKANFKMEINRLELEDLCLQLVIFMTYMKWENVYSFLK